MKNIHILPTPKPSRLHLAYDKDYYLSVEPFVQLDTKNYKSFNIYITSDEEIKPNVYALINKVLCKTELLEGKIVSRQLVGGATMDICKSEYLEIILTTDQDLIKDGVQAIDDEFLEWFVKNPSCEEVEVIKEDVEQPKPLYPNGNHKGERVWIETYKIIIPKEEPKQESLDEVAEIGKFAEKKYLERLDNFQKVDFKDGFIEGAKSQQERMYSEEEVRRIASRAFLIKSNNETILEDFDKWFKQYKKK